MRSLYTVPLAIAAGGIIVAIAVYVTVSREHQTTTTATNPALIRPVSPTDHIFGNPAAPVKIVEYSDFDCEYCRHFNATLQQIIATEGAKGQVAWVFREFPLTEIHPDALALARAAECAATAGGNAVFWKFEDALFTHQPVQLSDLGALAATTGVPGNAFTSCYATASTTVGARIQADRANALQMGARGTPYSVILAPEQPPVVMEGAYSYAAVKQLVDTALATLQSSSTSPSR